jgi:hypothetical protein
MIKMEVTTRHHQKKSLSDFNHHIGLPGEITPRMIDHFCETAPTVLSSHSGEQLSFKTSFTVMFDDRLLHFLGFCSPDAL